MILFMEYSSGGKRGGEYFHKNLHAFLIKRFTDTLPKKLEKLPPEMENPIKHAIHNLAFVKKLEPELIIADISSGVRNILAVRWMRKHRKKIMAIVLGQRMSFRYNIKLFEYIIRRCERFLLKNAHVILTNSEYTADYVRRHISKYAHVVVANPGLEIEIQGDDVIGNARNMGLPMGLLFVGECTKVKGLRYLIEALGLLKDLDIHLDIAGNYTTDRRYYREVWKTINEKGVQDRVKFHGFLETSQLAELYRRSSIFVLPSLSEGYGKVLAEALIYGLPIVASGVGNIPFMVKEKTNALLVEPADSIELANAIRALFSDPDLRRAMGNSNREMSKTIPTWDDFHTALERKLVPILKETTGIVPTGNIN